MSRIQHARVDAAARLHLGFLDLNGGLGRRFGSIGLTIDGPWTRLSLRRAKVSRILGPDSQRAGTHLAALKALFRPGAEYALTVDEAIPTHAGLGSGTALALAIAAAFRALEGLRDDLPRDARALGRGNRSGVGIATFRRGGLVIDGGRGPMTEQPPIIARLPFPPNWRIVLVQDTSMQGIHGALEQTAFSKLAPFRETEADRVCRLVLMQLLPALIEKDIHSFGQALSDIQSRLGDYFAPVQGGARFASAKVAAALGRLRRGGAHGVGQSSWGPTGFGFAESQDEAEQLVEMMRREQPAPDLDFSIRKGLNSGARIDLRAGETAPAASGTARHGGRDER